jgi:hypothetical protein
MNVLLLGTFIRNFYYVLLLGTLSCLDEGFPLSVLLLGAKSCLEGK